MGETWNLGIPHRLFFVETRTLGKYPKNIGRVRKYTKLVGN